MKARVLTVVMAMMLLVAFGGMAFAQGTAGQMGPNDEFQKKLGAAKAATFSGTVLSHDVACHCIVLKTAKGNLTLQDDYAKFEGDYDRAKGLKIGGKYAGNYKTVDYINYAIDVHEAK
jgi:hypothetical protein